MNYAPHVYLVCYDISDDKRLRRVYLAMRGYGDHMQYSVFRCVLSDIQLATMRDRLSREIDPSVDQVMIVSLGSAASKRSWRMCTIGRPLVHPERVVRVY